MKIIFDSGNGSLADVSFLTEDALLNPSVANSKLAKKKLKIERIEETESGEKIVHIKESASNILCG